MSSEAAKRHLIYAISRQVRTSVRTSEGLSVRTNARTSDRDVTRRRGSKSFSEENHNELAIYLL